MNNGLQMLSSYNDLLTHYEAFMLRFFLKRPLTHVANKRLETIGSRM